MGIDNDLSINDIKFLADLYGDSFYIFNSRRFKKNYEMIKESFVDCYSHFNIAYSYKTNYLPKCCEIVNDLDGYAEVVSEMELEIARRCGVSYDRIIWNGPIKNAKVLLEFLDLGGIPNIDNYEEWKTISLFANENPQNIIRVGIRCNFDIGDGVLSRFGLDIAGDDFRKVLLEIKETTNVQLYSIQCHFANRRPEFWRSRTEGMIRIYNSLADEYGIHPERIDLGGGLSGEMAEDFAAQIGQSGVKIGDYLKNSALIIEKRFRNYEKKPELVIEPGTAIVADTMQLVCQVKNIRSICGKWIATVSGSQKNISMQGINPPIQVLNFLDDGYYYDGIDIAGYTCIESDYLYRGYKGKLSVGDFVIIDYCGSYSLVNKPPFIEPNIPILDIGSSIENARLLKRRETLNDIFMTYSDV